MRNANDNVAIPTHLAYSYTEELNDGEVDGRFMHAPDAPETLPSVDQNFRPAVIMGNHPPTANLHQPPITGSRDSQPVGVQSSSLPDDPRRSFRHSHSSSSSRPSYSTTRHDENQQRPQSILTSIMNQQQNDHNGNDRYVTSAPQNDGRDININNNEFRISQQQRQQRQVYEADSASGHGPVQSVPLNDTNDYSSRIIRTSSLIPPPQNLSSSVPTFCPDHVEVPPLHTGGGSRNYHHHHHQHDADIANKSSDHNVRRCVSNRELGLLPNSSGSPHAFMMYQREVLEVTMQQRLMAIRETSSATPSPAPSTSADNERRHGTTRLTNETRNRRRAEHNNAVISDLCEIVTDLFVAESKLLNCSQYGVQSSLHRAHVLKSVQQFLSALPFRYALGVDTPSEVLLHMRLMAAARTNDTRAVVHICNFEGGGRLDRRETKTAAPTHTRPHTITRLVTISCADATGLLEFITNLLSTGGSRVIDADVMLTSDNIVLDRFVVEMNGRLRLDKLTIGIESFLKQAKAKESLDAHTDSSPSEISSSKSLSGTPPTSPGQQAAGPVYFHPASNRMDSPREIHEEIKAAVPLSQALSSTNNLGDAVPMRGRSFPKLVRLHSMPNPTITPINAPVPPSPGRSKRNSTSDSENQKIRQRRPLVNRDALDFSSMHISENLETRDIPLIPFEELMLIENLGTGRVSTIFRAAWQQSREGTMDMVALKVASVIPDSGDLAHIRELQHEADIAAMLHHPNVCTLVGCASDADCFCLAYEFCEGGSLLSLLTDTTRYYEYLPIALDICNGMAYLHNQNVIHRDLKPSNVLLTRDHRAKISDFGMSVANKGQDLTAETGTYRYMSPEVIRHESYSSNADVYSFGVVLWQLITREVPFATMTPIQAAYAVAEGRRPKIPDSCPARLREIICSCWDADSHKRPSFTYIAMCLADYAKMSFNPANVGAQTLSIANEMLENVQGNSTVNVDFSTPVAASSSTGSNEWFSGVNDSCGSNATVGLEI